MKIRLRNSVYIRQCAQMFLDGEMLGMKLQPYESHIPFTLSFLVDFDLYGCGLIEIDGFEKIEIANNEFEVNSNAIAVKNIGSLLELRSNDAALRNAFGVPKWESNEMGPKTQRLARTWKWEVSHEFNEYMTNSQSEISTFLEDQHNLDNMGDVSNSAKVASRILETQFTRGDVNYSAEFVADAMQLQYDSPSTNDVESSLSITVNSGPFYSNKKDAPVFPFVYGGKEFHLKSQDPVDLPNFDLTLDSSFPRLSTWIIYEGEMESPSKFDGLEYAYISPSTHDVEMSLMLEESQSMDISAVQMEVASLGSPEVRESDITVFSMEVFAINEDNKAPIASIDPVYAVFFEFEGEKGIVTYTNFHPGRPMHIIEVSNELQLIEKVIDLVQMKNPDILCGFEVMTQSWGYLRERYTLHTNDDLFIKLKRGCTRQGEINEQFDGVRGRHMLNFWSIIRKEVNLAKYNLEYVVLNALHKQIPKYTNQTLAKWWRSGNMKQMCQAAEYLGTRLSFVVQLLNHFEIVNKTCEHSRVIGIDFMSSLTRGSQFRVESLLCRFARRRNFVLISPNRAQVCEQNALEQIPLVMEPKSAFYTDPVCVLDFRSLYPSLIIAFNLCYSTCIGSLDNSKQRLGVKANFTPDAFNKSKVYVAPNGVGYVTPDVRKSLLAEMLSEILDTRFMINDTRKRLKDSLSPRVSRNLNNQQLALKLIANVTYGYTSASFSGRMPCAELADSIVLAGKELLSWCVQQAEQIAIQNGVEVDVVYGDTDSLFVKFANVTVEQAFHLGNELAEFVTANTPDPIHLKLEKVYSPSILLTKKRYVGRAYETPQSYPFFDAKGIEVIRRDGIPLTQKIERKALQILFDTKDLSLVKSYLIKKWQQILNNHIPLNDFCFNREVKEVDRYNPLNLPGGAVVSLRDVKNGEKAMHQHKERVSFLVCAGPPNSLINERVMSPQEFMRSKNAKIDYEYYIKKCIIPPLNRLFNVMGANVEDWYTKMPRPTMPPTVDEHTLAQTSLKCRFCSHLHVETPQTNSCENLDCQNYFLQKLCLQNLDY